MQADSIVGVFKHDMEIVHRDIKAENIFLTSADSVKLGDLGFSVACNKSLLLDTFCGSPPYAAPELYHDDRYVGVFVDIWAMGVLLYFMVCGMMPFKADTISKLKQLISDASYTLPDYLSGRCRALIRGILKSQPKDRLTIDGILGHAWLGNSEQFIKPMPKFDLTIPQDISSMSPKERAVLDRLTRLGLGLNCIRDALEQPHNPILGTVRVILFQTEHDRTPPVATAPPSPLRKAPLMKNGLTAQPSSMGTNTLQKHGPHRSRFCAIV